MLRAPPMAVALACSAMLAVPAHADEPACTTDTSLEEQIDTLTQAMTPLQTACTYGCAIAAGAGCAAVGGACTAGAIWTVGGVSFPCVYAVIAACGAYNAIGVTCALQCSR